MSGGDFFLLHSSPYLLEHPQCLLTFGVKFSLMLYTGINVR